MMNHNTTWWSYDESIMPPGGDMMNQLGQFISWSVFLVNSIFFFFFGNLKGIGAFFPVFQ